MADEPPITFVRLLSEPFESRRALARGALAGSEKRVARGAYLAAMPWNAATIRERYLLSLRAMAETRRDRPVLSHWSAAFVHGLPILGRWPDRLHVATSPANGGRSSGAIVRHPTRLRDSDVVELNGFRVTSVERTLVDLATVTSFMSAVISVDRALLIDRFGRVPARTTRERVLETFGARQPMRAHARVRAAIEFGEERAESPLESVSRVTMRAIGAPKPTLQIPHFDDEGHIGDPDFCWRKFGIVGEADGSGKYLDPEIRGDRSAEEVVLDEKDREDRLRAIGRTVTRWRWAVGISPERLRARLSRAGLPMGQPWV